MSRIIKDEHINIKEKEILNIPISFRTVDHHWTILPDLHQASTKLSLYMVWAEVIFYSLIEPETRDFSA